jgi:hypothetical protein
MRVLRVVIPILLAGVCGVSQTRSDKERIIGAWRLVSIVGPDGKRVTTDVPVGMLIYTRDGHVSVQLMYPASEKAMSNEYVENGYEASFGSYEINSAAHTVTHHVQGANTRERLVGKDLPRVYAFDGKGRLIIRPARAEEHWFVTWEHY